MCASRCGRRHWPVSPSLWCVLFTCRWTRGYPRAGALALEPFALDRLPEVKPSRLEFKRLVKDLCASVQILVLAGPAASVEATPLPDA